MTAAEHLADARGLFDLLAAFEPATDDDASAVIEAFWRMAAHVQAGLDAAAEDPMTSQTVRAWLLRLHGAVVEIGAAGVAAGTIERARLGG
jgi:hypothetical protein